MINGKINGSAARDARIAAGFKTQSDLAAKIGCSRVTISRAESSLGGRGILHKIAAATGVPPRALMQVSGESAAMPVTAQERELLAAEEATHRTLATEGTKLQPVIPPPADLRQ